MSLDNLPLFSALHSRMNWLNNRQQLISQNVANSDTPGFIPKDLKSQDFKALLRGQASGAGVNAHMVPLAGGGLGAGSSLTSAKRPVSMWATHQNHMAVNPPPAPIDGEHKAPDSETKLDGNSVVLEEEMLKMAESRMAYDEAVTFYQKSMQLLQLASRQPGR